MLWFLIFSLLSGLIELGGVFFGIALELPIWAVLVMPLMYQIGNLAFIPHLFTRRIVAFTAFINVLLLLLNTITANIVLIGINIMLTSICIQAVRYESKNNCPTWLKRSFRIGGFLLSPVMAFGFIPTLILCATATLLTAFFFAVHRTKKSPQKIPFALNPVMMFHQMHYFVYTYIMPIAVFLHTRNPFITSLIFGATWIVYLSPQVAIEKCRRYNPRKVFFLCHSFLAIVMAVMSFMFYREYLMGIIIMWLLTGLGGGSVFTICKLTIKSRNTDMTFSENFGHVAGALAAVILAALYQNNTAVVLTSFSVMFVCITLLSASISIWKEKKYYGKINYIQNR